MKLQELAHKNKIEVIRDALTEIAASNDEGLLTAEAVVETARHPDHALHPFFTWEDSSAAEKYRLLEARTLIRKVRVLPENGETNGKSVPKYFSLMSDRQREGGGYRETETIVNDADLLAELEATAKKELQGWLDRHAALTEMCQKVARAAGVPIKKRKKAR